LKAETNSKAVEKNNIGLTPHLSKNILETRRVKKEKEKETFSQKNERWGGWQLYQSNRSNQSDQSRRNQSDKSDQAKEGEGGKSQNSRRPNPGFHFAFLPLPHNTCLCTEDPWSYFPLGQPYSPKKHG
jgi:hypothetical protein